MRRFISIFGLLIVMAIATLSSASCGSRPGTVEGMVTEAESGEAVQQAQVSVFALERFEDVSNLEVYEKGNLLTEQLTDENGKFSLSVEPGSYVIQVWTKDLEAADRMVQVKSGRVTTVDFSLGIPSP